jgi:DNA-binding response OmpR family regulator
MPGMDGLELCRKIRERPSTDYTYFILLTANTGKDNLRRAMEIGVDDFLAKPIEFEDLKVRMRVAERIVGLTRRVAQLEGILPICMYCKNIRETDNTYERVETYIAKRTQAQFSHGICPQCMAERFPEGWEPRNDASSS